MKLFKKLLSHLVSPFSLGLLVTLGVVYTSLVYYTSQHQANFSKENRTVTSRIRELHEKTIDWRLADRGYQVGSDRVAILAIDEDSVSQEGRWPWPREKQAKLIDRTVKYGAKAIAFDIVYPEEDNTSAIPALQSLRRSLGQKIKVSAPALSTDVDTMITTQLEQSDSDSVFAATIRTHADKLILGAYSDDEQTYSPATEFCFDALYSRTYDQKYWNKDGSPVIVIDEPLNKLGFPKEFKEQMSTYFLTLENSRAKVWFDNNKEAQQRVNFSLEELSEVLPPETIPGIATLYYNDDTDLAKSILEAVKPEMATYNGVRTLFRRFSSALTKKELASLRAEVRKSGADYCLERFFTQDDELLNIEKWKELWGGSPEEVREQFSAAGFVDIWAKLQSLESNTVKETLDQAVERFRRQSLKNAVANVDRWWVNIPALSDATKFSGYFNAVQDTDGSIRRTRLITRQGNSYAPSLPLKTFLVDKGLSAIAAIDVENVGRNEAKTKVVRSFKLIDTDGNSVMTLPADNQGNLMINYSGPRNMFPYIRAADVLSEEPTANVTYRVWDPLSRRWRMDEKRVNKEEFLKDKLLLVGATAVGIYDLRVTPFDENFPGVETHANVLSNLLIEHAKTKGEKVEKGQPGFMRTHPIEEKLMWIALLSIGVTLSGLLAYFGSVVGLAITLLFLLGIYIVDKFVLFQQGIVIATIFPVSLVTFNFVSLTFYKYFTEERKKRELKGTFEKYVSPAIVAEVLSDPTKIELGGRKTDLTVMFSDVRGFTTISEKLDPRELSNLLNSYLTPMTNLVFKNKGTLDKYMGDAIMAFWGAPIHFPDHAKHACRCALQMLEKLRELQAEYRSKGLPEIDIGIGLNTGDMSVGNMGSDTVRSYTVMGDAVNLGSRLEGINKKYGTRIIISEFTQKTIGSDFVTREVDWVKVKGKNQPVRIFELIAEGKPSQQKAEFLAFYNQGFNLFHECKFSEAAEAFRNALKVEPDDYLSSQYVDLCEEYVANPPPENWDGVATMKEK